MRSNRMIVALVLAVALIGAVYHFQAKYKYSCAADDQCYPCTRWMNCVNEEFYLRNTMKCRIGAEENFTRVICGCQTGMCQTKQILPLNKTHVDEWVPPDD